MFEKGSSSCRWTAGPDVRSFCAAPVSSSPQSRTVKQGRCTSCHSSEEKYESNHVVYYSLQAMIFFKFNVDNTFVMLCINGHSTTWWSHLSSTHISLQWSFPVYIALIILPALFVLAQGQTGIVEAKSFIVKQFLNNFKLSHLESTCI